MATVAQLLEALAGAYDPAWAEQWDAVGLVTGDPDAPVGRVLLAVDPSPEVAQEAVELGADLLVTHHPLFLRGVHGVAATTAGGRTASRLISAGIALYAAHTNADVARPGVSDALARAVGLTGELDVLSETAASVEALDALDVYVPTADRQRVLDALGAAGAGALGDYSRCGWWTAGTATFLPGPQASPARGTPGQPARVGEECLQVVAPRAARARLIAALRAAHPYEEPAFRVTELAIPAPRGLGRVGALGEPMDLLAFAGQVAAGLPAVAGGLRVAGRPGTTVRRVAVCGGAGDDLAGAALARGADVLVTADCRHHRVRDAVEAGLAVVDVAHWASEWPWLAQAARVLEDATGSAPGADRVTCTVSTLVTDPWTASVPSPVAGRPA